MQHHWQVVKKSSCIDIMQYNNDE